jgi:hypothetical protein
MQRTPAGLPCGIPGIGDEMDGAMQQAPHPIRHSMTPWAEATRLDEFVNLHLPFQPYWPISSIFLRRLSGRMSVQTSLI